MKMVQFQSKSAQAKSRVKRGFEPRFRFSLWSDCRGSVFARVVARRQKEMKRGIDTYAQRVCRRRRDRSCLPLFDFWYFWSRKSTPAFSCVGQSNFSRAFGHAKARPPFSLRRKNNPSPDLRRELPLHKGAEQRASRIAFFFALKKKIPARKTGGYFLLYISLMFIKPLP